MKGTLSFGQLLLFGGIMLAGVGLLLVYVVPQQAGQAPPVQQQIVQPGVVQVTSKTVNARVVDILNTTADPSYVYGNDAVVFRDGTLQATAQAVASGSGGTNILTSQDPRATGTIFLRPNRTSCGSEVYTFGQAKAVEQIDIKSKRFGVGQIRMVNDAGTVISGYSDINITTSGDGAISVGAGGTTNTINFDVDGTNTTDAIYGCNINPGEGLAVIVRMNTTVWDKSTSGFSGSKIQKINPLAEESTYLTSTYSTTGDEFLVYLIPATKSNTLANKEPNLATRDRYDFKANARSGQNPGLAHNITVYVIPRSTYYSTVTNQYKTAFATDDITPVRVITSTWIKSVEVQ